MVGAIPTNNKVRKDVKQPGVKNPPCPICKETDTILWQDFDGSFSFGMTNFFPIHTKKYGCWSCCHVFSTNLPNANYLEGHYENQDRNRHSMSNKNSLHKKGYYLSALAILNKIVKDLCSQKRASISVLDLGCGSGEIIVALKRRFPKLIAHGIDINPSAKEAEKFADVKIRVGQFPDTSFNVKYDLVILSGFLEHQKNPILFLKQIKKIIKSNGTIFVEIPDAFSILTKRQDLAQKRVHDIMNDEHLHHFSLNSLLKVVGKAGFVVVQHHKSSKGIWEVLQVVLRVGDDKGGIVFRNYKRLFFDGFSQYTSTKAILRRRLKKVFQIKKGLAIYGAGWHTSIVLPQLFSQLIQRDFMIFDSNSLKAHLQLFGRKITSSSDSSINNPDYFLLSTLENLDEFEKFIISVRTRKPRPKLIRLYKL